MNDLPRADTVWRSPLRVLTIDSYWLPRLDQLALDSKQPDSFLDRRQRRRTGGRSTVRIKNSSEHPTPTSSARPGASPAGRRYAPRALAALLVGAGALHFAKPEFFDAIVPTWVPIDARTTTHLSGAVELLVGAGLAYPRTRRVAGWAAAATFVVVYPANIWAALEGGMKQASPPLDSAAAAWLRLPLQIPLIWWATKVAKNASEPRETAPL